MKIRSFASILSFVLLGLLSTSQAEAQGNSPDNPNRGPGCRQVSGRLTETLIHPFGSPGDPFGRVLGNATGFLNGAETAIVLGFRPQGDGTIEVDTINVFSTDIGDTLMTEGSAVFTPIPGTRDVHNDLTLEILGDLSTGRFAGARGTIHLQGIGFNLFPPEPGPPAPTPGETQFIFRYSGTICGLKPDSGE
jgi:hypothetical protein